MPLRVVAGRVRVNVGIAKMNRDIISGDGDTVFVVSFASGSNLDRLIFWRLDINGAAPSSRKKKKKKKRARPEQQKKKKKKNPRPASPCRARRYRRAKVWKRRKGPSRFRLGGA